MENGYERHVHDNLVLGVSVLVTELRPDGSETLAVTAPKKSIVSMRGLKKCDEVRHTR